MIFLFSLLFGLCLFGLLLKDENHRIKNFNTLVVTIAVISAAYFSYIEFIQKKEDKEKLPPVFNINASMEKVGEEDSCYIVKAVLNYENVSDRRIYILLSSFYITGIKISKGGDTLKEGFPIDKFQVSYHSKEFKYSYEDILYSQKLDVSCWYDNRNKTNYNYIIKIPKKYDVIDLIAEVNLANVSDESIKDYTFSQNISKEGQFQLEVRSAEGSKELVSDSVGLQLVDKYGLIFTHSNSQLYLKGDIANKR